MDLLKQLNIMMSFWVRYMINDAIKVVYLRALGFDYMSVICSRHPAGIKNLGDALNRAVKILERCS
jgi:hypothetical protein